MDEKTAEIGRLIAKSPPGPVALGHLLRKLRQDWRTLRHLAKKAQARVRSAPGFKSKVNEIRWIAGKAQNRIATRLGLASAAPVLPQTDQHRRMVLEAQRTSISALLPGTAQKPACLPVGGGAFLVAMTKQDAAAA